MQRLIQITLLAGLFLSFPFAPSSALAATKSTVRQYSVGLYQDDNSCDFGEKYELPDEIDGIFKLTIKTSSSKKGTITKLSLSRSGKFPFPTSLKKVKASSRGFKASGSKTSGTKAYTEKISLSAGHGGGTASLHMLIVEAGSECDFSYSGDALIIRNN